MMGITEPQNMKVFLQCSRLLFSLPDIDPSFVKKNLAIHLLVSAAQGSVTDRYAGRS